MFSPFFNTLLGKRKDPSPPQSDTESSHDESETGDDIIDEDGNNPQDEEEEVLIEEPEEALDADFDISTATLGQLLTRIIPDADVHCPNVIILGGQSSGKTKMIISMVFHHLIENSSVTDVMGEKLLRIFRTGEKMVTRRPTKIQFVKAAKDSPCEISLRLGNDSASFGDSKFEEIIDTVHQESATKDGRAFRGELRVTISAPGLPNISFTDLPGLITDDRNLSDCHEGEAMSIRKLVKAYMRQPQTTLIVVEPASIEDFETSQVSPLLKDVRDSSERQHIFSNAVLVLSKCDKIRQGLERRIMSIIERTSPSLNDFPYQHVVGVVNKIETAEEAPEEITSYAAFKQQFKATKAHERAIFSAFLQKDGITPCSTKEQCTTSAVFHQMDKITFGLMHHSIEKGLESIQEKVNLLEQKIRDELAPPLSFYDTVVHTSASGTGDVEISKAKRKNILKLLRINLKNIIASKFKSAPELSIYECHSYDQQLIAASQSNFLASLGVEWPADFTPGDMLMSAKQSDAIEVLRKYFNRYIDRKIKAVVSEVFADRVTGCFAPIHSRFHRIDRFPRLVEALHQGFHAALPECVKAAREAVSTYLLHFWEFEVPKGAKLDGIVDQLKHVALRQMFETLRVVTKGEQFDALLSDDTLFEEEAGFVALRNQLQGRWYSLYQQATILGQCKSVKSNDDLRVTLQQAYAEELSAARASPSQDSWLEFWHRAETAPPLTTTSSTAAGRSQNHLGVNPPSTSMYSAEPFSSSQSMDVDGAASGASAGREMGNDSGSRMDAPEDPPAASGHRGHRSQREDDVTPYKRYKTGHDAADDSNWASYKNNGNSLAGGAAAFLGSPLRSALPTPSSSAHKLLGSFANTANSFLNNVFTGSPQPTLATAAGRYGSSQSQSQSHSPSASQQASSQLVFHQALQHTSQHASQNGSQQASIRQQGSQVASQQSQEVSFSPSRQASQQQPSTQSRPSSFQTDQVGASAVATAAATVAIAAASPAVKQEHQQQSRHSLTGDQQPGNGARNGSSNSSSSAFQQYRTGGSFTAGAAANGGVTNGYGAPTPTSGVQAGSFGTSTPIGTRPPMETIDLT